jgi:hypothetical protein
VSPSASPSEGYAEYSRGDYASKPGGIDDLITAYTEQDYLDVTDSDDVRVEQSLDGAVDEYAIHQFKDYVLQNSCTVRWEGQSNYSCSETSIFLEIYNRTTSTWDYLDWDFDSPADIDLILTADVADLTDYKDSNNVIVCRVVQPHPGLLM